MPQQTDSPDFAPSKPRFLTEDILGIGGAFKLSAADFIVDERPLYPFSGEGEHLFVRIEKIGISTFEAVRRIAQATGVKEIDIGSAGLKDARATARQWLSIPRTATATADRVRQLDLKGIAILEVTAHGNKLRRGHLAGNAFSCVLRGVDPAGETRARAILERLGAEGLPNHFGDQRFGMHGDTHRLGLALIQNDPGQLVARMLGPTPTESDSRVRAARDAFATGDVPRALELMPPTRNTERRLLKWLVENPGDDTGAVKLLPKKLKAFFVSAFQSALFNRCVDVRLPDLRTLRAGDVAYIHGKGASFVVEDVSVEQPRADAFEISPSGPIFGTKTLMGRGDVGRFEQSLLDEFGLVLESFKLPGGLTQTGARRPLRVPLTDVRLEWNVPAPPAAPESEPRSFATAAEMPGQRAVAATTCTVHFFLGAGCYATNVLAEVCKGAHPPIVPQTDTA